MATQLSRSDPSDRAMPLNDRDSFWMAQALSQAERGLGMVEPNPMVGAILVRDGKQVGQGHHQVFGGPHAEVLAIRDAGDQVPGSTLYVTLEPCCHQGKTPPCTEAVLSAGIRRVVVAMRDPFPAVSGHGITTLRKGGIEVEVGLLGPLATALNAPYLKRIVQNEPYVIAKWAMTLDGKMATSTGQSAWISNQASRSRVHELRGRVDAIVVGINTVLADDPLLTVRPPGHRTPLRVILDRRGRLPIGSRIVQTAREVPTLVVCQSTTPTETRQRLTESGLELFVYSAETATPVRLLLQEFGRRRFTNVLVEGGGKVLGLFFDENCIDEVDVYVAMMIEGGKGSLCPFLGQGVESMSSGRRLQSHELSQIETDVRIRGKFAFPWLDDPSDSG